MSLFEAYALDTDIVTATQDASDQEHLMGECTEVELFNLLQLVNVNLIANATVVHLEEAPLASESQQV